MKNIGKFLLLAFFLSVSSLAYAECAKHSMKQSSSAATNCPIISKFLKKSDFFLDNQKEIGLSDDQVKTIKSLKLKVDKIVIAQDAAMKTFALDAGAKMAETKVDVEGLNAMIDEGMSAFAGQTKEVVAAYAEMKAILTTEQMAKAKEIWMAGSEKQCPMMGSHSGSSGHNEHKR